MRHFSYFILATALVSIGCSHQSKTADAPVKPAAAAAPAADKTTPEPKGSESASKVECSKKGDDRILESRAKDTGCELGYTKAGNESIVATASHGTSYCEKALEKLRGKLSDAGYECK
jgi:hypothetical protein